MAVPVVLMAAGAGIKAWSGYMANVQKGAQEQENAKWLAEQAEFAREAMFREIRRTEQEYTNKVGQQVGSYAASGVDASGSAAYTVGATIAGSFQELAAVRRKGEMDYKLAMARSRLASKNADALLNPLMNIVQAGGTLLQSYTDTGGFGQGFGWASQVSSNANANVVSSGGLPTTPNFGTGYQSAYLGPIGTGG